MYRKVMSIRLRLHRHEYEYEYWSGFLFVGCRSLTHMNEAFTVTCTST